jgi:hypothetical protein
MCDYSLHYVASRPAKVGDKLVATNFANSISRGFAAVGEPNVAVCLLPGTEVAFERNVECQPAIGILPKKKIGQRVARFRQINKDKPHVHHDALEFADGQIVLLTTLRPGQHATVLQLPVAPRTAEEAEEQRRVPVVALSITPDELSLRKREGRRAGGISPAFQIPPVARKLNRKTAPS